MPRYIDAEALETALLAEQNCDRSNAYGAYECDLIAHVYESARQLCGRIPTADVEPVRHGRWKDGNCSVCSVPAVMMRQVDGVEIRIETPRCPNCGARMAWKARWRKMPRRALYSRVTPLIMHRQECEGCMYDGKLLTCKAKELEWALYAMKKEIPLLRCISREPNKCIFREEG